MQDWPELQKLYASNDTYVFYGDSKTDLKLPYKIPAIRGFPRRF